MVEENVGREDPCLEAIGNIDSCGMFFGVGMKLYFFFQLLLCFFQMTVFCMVNVGFQPFLGVF